MKGGAGSDELEFSLFSTGSGSEGNGGTARATDNVALLSGADGQDSLQVEVSARADSEGSATTSGNAVTLLGGDGADLLSAEVFAEASQTGSALTSDNVVVLEGGKGADTLSLTLREFTFDASTAALSDNDITLNAGEGNAVTLNGGKGIDTALLSYANTTEDLSFDFSAGYKQALADGTKLLGIEQVTVYGGLGDDEFIGGRGDDIFDGGFGEDTASYKGGFDDYDITQLASGAVQITDLRSGSPNGTDVIWNTEAFVFAGQEVDLV
jgi:Ca2+-binding RTX toxin-like protein